MPVINPSGGGGGGGPGLPTQWTASPNGAVVATVDHPAATALEVAGFAGQTAPLFRALSADSSGLDIESDGAGGGVGNIDLFNTAGADISMNPAGDVNLQAVAVLSLNAPVVRWRQSSAEPADGQLNASEFALWLDDTPAATRLMVKAKDSAGTVKTAAVALA